MHVNDVTAIRWIDLDGAVNVRDLGGLPTVDGRATAAHRLIRADNLQDLSDRDVKILVDEIGVRAVADLRTDLELRLEGPAPLDRDERVQVRHLSLVPEAGDTTDVAAVADGKQPVILPWQTDESDEQAPSGPELGAAGTYLEYLEDRGDAVVEALRLIAHSPGATIVHCAAGKDRTGTVVALALTEAGVIRDAIVADYQASAQRIDRIFARLDASPTYTDDVRRRPPEEHAPRPETMRRFLDLVDQRWGGVARWLRLSGWTEHDARTLRAKLLAS
jgi:protein tyrosine/serine phosphatase